MARAKAKKSMPWQWSAVGRRQEEDEAKPQLPPLEAFSFKGIMADLQESDIGADLDRIAEICARSRYSLSNQYEVHVTPHGSGTAFVAAGQSSNTARRRGSGHRKEGGPTLQAVQSDDDENNAKAHRKRRSGGRRRSAAYGTLETIMSSSRSSEEDKTKKKSASELTEEVLRGRAARKGSGPSAAESASGSTTNEVAGDHPNAPGRNGKTQGAKGAATKKSTSFAHAVIESTRHGAGTGITSPRSSSTALLSAPALPQTSNSHLEIRTAPDSPSEDNSRHTSQPTSQPESPTEGAVAAESELVPDLTHTEDPGTSASGGLLYSFGGWIPWRPSGAGSSLNQRGGLVAQVTPREVCGSC